MHFKRTRFAAAIVALIGTTVHVAGDDGAGVIPHGVIEDSGWALARLNNADGPVPTAKATYRYPESTRPVRLYLIDTAVDNSSGWFDGNPNLTFSERKTFPAGSSSIEFGHGTRMLSIIAGPERGAATGVPIELHAYDIYTEGSTPGSSNLGLMIEAILRATVEHELAKLADPDTLGVICLANGTGKPARSSALLSAIDQAIGAGLVVVTSAGNEARDVLNGTAIEKAVNGSADAYLPGAYGSARDGLICVGASTADNKRSSLSNFGKSVELYAPGVDVMTFDSAASSKGQNLPVQGTSPATALVAAAVIAERSRQPDLDPAEIEAALKARVAADEVPIVQIDDDLDADGAVDQIERFFGYSVTDPASTPPAPALSLGKGTTELSFTISSDLWQAEEPMKLADSSGWRLLASYDLVNWTELGTFISYGEKDEGRIPVTVLMPRDASLEEQATANDSSPSRAIDKDTLNGLNETMKQLFDEDREVFPDWYWESLGIDTASSSPDDPKTSAIVAPRPSGIFYRIEVISNP